MEPPGASMEIEREWWLPGPQVLQRPRTKFGTVNALLGGLDQVAVDPGQWSSVFVVIKYSIRQSKATRLAIHKLIYGKNQ